MSLWNHLNPDDLHRTRNYGLAGGWLTPPTSDLVSAEEARELSAWFALPVREGRADG